MLSNKIDKEEIAKVPIKFKEVEGGKRLVYDFNEMLSFLDLGPGYGNSLDLAREGGAKIVEFVEYNPYLMAFNVLKGFRGYMLNYIIGKGLTPLYPKKYDVILSRGSINADRFNRKETGFIPLDKWIQQVENLSSPNGHIIICPSYDRGKKNMGGYNVCKDPVAFKQSWFSKVLQEKGYKIIYVEKFNMPKQFQFTFYKKRVNLLRPVFYNEKKEKKGAP